VKKTKRSSAPTSTIDSNQRDKAACCPESTECLYLLFRASRILGQARASVAIEVVTSSCQRFFLHLLSAAVEIPHPAALRLSAPFCKRGRRVLSCSRAGDLWSAWVFDTSILDKRGTRIFIEVARGAAPAYSNFKSEIRISKQFQNDERQRMQCSKRAGVEIDVVNFPRCDLV